MTLHEKYEIVAKGKRENRNLIWVTNIAMNDIAGDSGQPVLIQVPANQYAVYQGQGYSKYTPQVKVAPPTEAKKVSTPAEK